MRSVTFDICGILAKTHSLAFKVTRSWSAQEFTQLGQGFGAILFGSGASFVVGRLIADEAEILTVSTSPDFQRQGYALRALNDFEAYVSQHGGVKVFLEVAADNTTAQALYMRCGYCFIAERARYYKTLDGSFVSAYMYEKKLV